MLYVFFGCFEVKFNVARNHDSVFICTYIYKSFRVIFALRKNSRIIFQDFFKEKRQFFIAFICSLGYSSVYDKKRYGKFFHSFCKIRPDFGFDNYCHLGIYGINCSVYCIFCVIREIGNHFAFVFEFVFCKLLTLRG